MTDLEEYLFYQELQRQKEPERIYFNNKNKEDGYTLENKQ